MLISGYTREAGLRNLEREIGAIARHAAVQVAEGKSGPGLIGPDDLHEIIGPRRVDDEIALRTGVAGVATGLAWTPAGGDILFVEASRAPGNGKLTITGQLGDVMRESAQAALSLVKARAESLRIDQERLDKSDIHIHVPAGAIKKDGPSAGVALYTALVSLLTDRNVRADVAMTGEISLRGQVLPIGGVKEKTLAAHQAGIKTVMLPDRNRKRRGRYPRQRARGAGYPLYLERRGRDRDRAGRRDRTGVIRRQSAAAPDSVISRHYSVGRANQISAVSPMNSQPASQ